MRRTHRAIRRDALVAAAAAYISIVAATEMADWSKRVFLGALLGAAIGVLAGLVLSRFVWQVPTSSPAEQAVYTQSSPMPTASMLPAATAASGTAYWDADELLLLVSGLYALDGDLARARQRLDASGLADPAGSTADLARRHAQAGNRQLATDLATLAAALGDSRSDLLAYVATAPPAPTTTPTATPTAKPTGTQPPTSLPSPLAIATASPTLAPTITPTSLPAATRHRATPRPSQTAPPPSPAPTARPLAWDHRVDLLSPPIRLVGAEVAPGDAYWRLVRLEWRKAPEGGNMLLYINTLDQAGQPIWGQEVVIENGGHTSLHTTPQEGNPYGANFPMGGTLGSYQAFIGGPLPSDRVTGMGLGETQGWTDHTSFILEFQRATK